MKRNLAKILALVLILSLLVPGMSFAASTDTYKVTVTLSGPDQNKEQKSIPNSVSMQAASAKLSAILLQLEAAVHDDIEEAFGGTAFGTEYYAALDLAKEGSSDDWSAWVTKNVTASDAVLAVVTNKDATVWDLAQVSTNAELTFKADENYKVTIALMVDTVVPEEDEPEPITTTTPTPTPEPTEAPETTTTTTENEDGSVTETTTATTTTENEDGSVTEKVSETETTTAADGSTTETARETETTTTEKEDGSTTAETTATETKTETDAEGNVTTTETTTETKETTDADGNVSSESKSTETVKDADGNVTQTTETESVSAAEVNEDGDKTTTTTNTVTVTDAEGNTETTVTEEKTVEQADGSTGTVVADADGNTLSAEASLSEEATDAAAESGEIITLPIEVKATEQAEDAAEIAITLSENVESVKIEIPVENLTPSTVAVIVYEDGTEEIVKTSVTSEDGVVLTLEGSATVKIVDNSKEFDDVAENKWYTDDVAWASSREIMNGTDKGFEPELETSRGMVTQLLFNLDGAEAGEITESFDDVSADDWYAAGVSWAEETGVAQGHGNTFGAEENITREQVAVMLYNYAQYKGYDVSATDDMAAFTDAGDVSDWAEAAMRWAVGVGLINGMGDGTVNPQGFATRAQVAALMQRFCEKVA